MRIARTRSALVTLAALLILGPGCEGGGSCRGAFGRPNPAASGPTRVAAPTALPALTTGRGLEQVGWEGEDVRGLSGLGRDPAGTFYAVPERVRRLLVFTFAGGRPVVGGPALPITGVPGGFDLESLAWVGTSTPSGEVTLAMGTETDERGRDHDLIVFARLGPAALSVTGTLTFPYAPWGLTAGRNQGLEGLCAAAGWMLAASEVPGRAGDRRFAPLGAFDLGRRRWTPHRLWLTSGTGKISALACRDGPRGIEALAIERHFEVMRVLRFSLPAPGAAGDVSPEIACDLAARYPKPPNFEGIEWLDAERLVLVSDNDFGGVTGPAIIATLTLTACR